MINYIVYGDTDSMYIDLGSWLTKLNPAWTKLTDDKKIGLLLDTCKLIQGYVNKHVFEDVQLGEYNSIVTDFKIEFKQELIAKRALFITKKRYAYWACNNEGVPCDEIEYRGLEVVRSETPIYMRKALKDIINNILRGMSHDELKVMINEHIKYMESCDIDEIASNINVKDLYKYMDKDGVLREDLKNISGGKLGIPRHIVGTANNIMMAKKLNIDNKYEPIIPDQKAKVVYLKPNNFNLDSMTYIEWPAEFTNIGLEVDRSKIINKQFISKLEAIFKHINLLSLLNINVSIEEFF